MNYVPKYVRNIGRGVSFVKQFEKYYKVNILIPIDKVGKIKYKYIP